MTEPLQAVIHDGTVTNVIVCTTDTVQQFRDLGIYDDAFGAGAVLVDVTHTVPRPGIGWTSDGGTFTAPPPPATLTTDRDPLPVGETATVTYTRQGMTDGETVTFDVNGTKTNVTAADGAAVLAVTTDHTDPIIVQSGGLVLVINATVTG